MHLHREYHCWHSPSLQREMELLVFGHAGARLVVFPTSMGRFFDWEHRQMPQALQEPLANGWLQMYFVDSVDSESWYNYAASPRDRVRRHDQYDAYLLREVLPFTAARNPNPFLMVAGASFGGYHAINFGLRHPQRVGRVISMSGLADISRFADGQKLPEVYFHNPVEYLALEHDPARLDALRNVDIILAVGRDDPLRASNERLSSVLWSKGIWHALRIWDGFAHDWPDWQHMLRLYLNGHD